MKNAFLAFALLAGCNGADQQSFIAENAGDPAAYERLNNKVVSMTLESAFLLPSCELALAGQLVWLIAEQEFRTCNYKTLQWDVVSIVGQKGDNGTNGSNGAGCTIAQVSNGANVTCGNTTVFVANGTNGTNGSNGTSCSVARSHRFHEQFEYYIPGNRITCGATDTFIDDPIPSLARSFPNLGLCPVGSVTGDMIMFYLDVDYSGSYGVFDMDYEATIVCGGVNGAVGAAGAAGQPCSVTQGTGGSTVTCGGSTAFIANGADVVPQKVPVLYVNNQKIGQVYGEDVQLSIVSKRVVVVREETTNEVFLYDTTTGSPERPALFFKDPDCTGSGYVEKRYFNSLTTILMLGTGINLKTYDTRNAPLEGKSVGVPMQSWTSGIGCNNLVQSKTNVYRVSATPSWIGVPEVLRQLATPDGTEVWDIRVE